MTTIATRSLHDHRTAACLRPARADDAAAVGSFLQGLSDDSRRQRFHGPCNPGSASLALGLCRVDGVRHQAWLAWADDGDAAVVVGEARIVRGSGTDAASNAAELAIVVADDWQGSGLADTLMTRLLQAAAVAGVETLYGDVLDTNVRMQAFMRRHGFESEPFSCGEVLRLSRASPACRSGWARTTFKGLMALFAPSVGQADLPMRRDRCPGRRPARSPMAPMPWRCRNGVDALATSTATLQSMSNVGTQRAAWTTTGRRSRRMASCKSWPDWAKHAPGSPARTW